MGGIAPRSGADRFAGRSSLCDAQGPERKALGNRQSTPGNIPYDAAQILAPETRRKRDPERSDQHDRGSFRRSTDQAPRNSEADRASYDGNDQSGREPDQSNRYAGAIFSPGASARRTYGRDFTKARLRLGNYQRPPRRGSHLSRALSPG